ncbi:hypothetical protein F4802DRAFT_600060 [Xylaria palmicola]|nr:hypothetical protein F4802DRAFT_600060 [Xylaria palmicola]
MPISRMALVSRINPPSIRPLIRRYIINSTKDLQMASNPTHVTQVLENTLDKSIGSSFDIIPASIILSFHWGEGEYYFGGTGGTGRLPGDRASTTSIRTLWSQRAGSAQLECEQLAALLRAKNIAFDNTSTSHVVLARPNDRKQGTCEHAALLQVTASLVTSLAPYVSGKLTSSMALNLLTMSMPRFLKRNEPGAGIRLLSTISSLDLEGKGLFIIVDLSEIDMSEDSLSSYRCGLAKALRDITFLNEAVVLRVEGTRTGTRSFVHYRGLIREF